MSREKREVPVICQDGELRPRSSSVRVCLFPTLRSGAHSRDLEGYAEFLRRSG
jgi:hypothetical protein